MSEKSDIIYQITIINPEGTTRELLEALLSNARQSPSMVQVTKTAPVAPAPPVSSAEKDRLWALLDLPIIELGGSTFFKKMCRVLNIAYIGQWVRRNDPTDILIPGIGHKTKDQVAPLIAAFSEANGLPLTLGMKTFGWQAPELRRQPELLAWLNTPLDFPAGANPQGIQWIMKRAQSVWSGRNPTLLKGDTLFYSFEYYPWGEAFNQEKFTIELQEKGFSLLTASLWVPEEA